MINSKLIFFLLKNKYLFNKVNKNSKLYQIDMNEDEWDDFGDHSISNFGR